MRLEKWGEYGWLKAEATSRDEIKGLLTIVERDLKDANVAAVSEDRRFEAATVFAWLEKNHPDLLKDQT
jgi:hypothetical protein